MRTSERFTMLILLLLLSFAACNEANVARIEKSSQPVSTPVPMDTLKMTNFTGPQRKAWEAATKFCYETEYFGGCLKTLGFELNCTDCTNIGLNLELTVDSTGKILATKELSAKIYCSKHSEDEELKMKECLLQSFPQVVLPEAFHNKILIVFVGRVPMC